MTLFSQEEFGTYLQNNLDFLVRNYFIKEGQCANVSNISSIGPASNIGLFRGGERLLRMDSGIVFSTGFLNNIAQNNLLPDNTGQLNLGSDQDLQRIAARPVQDAVGLEFDFVPNADVVTFEYVFASEEYCEYVDDVFNDVFGFFVSGPGIFGDFNDNAINVAVIPNTKEKVSINTVNHKTNRDFFVANFTEADARMCGLPYEPEKLKGIEFDGYTTRLRAVIEVIPCETYRLRLVVGDVADDILDSGVFLAANSFDLGTAVDVTSWVGDTLGDTFYENCLDAKFVFTKNITKGDTSTKIFNYTVTGTATPGVDYEILPGSVRIPPGQRTAEVPIRVIPDAEREPFETIVMVVEFFSCDCIERDTAILYLGDSDYDFEVELGDFPVCRDQAFKLSPEISGGAAPFKYSWSTGDSLDSIELVLSEPSALLVTVEDVCGASDTAMATFSFRPPPSGRALADPFFCVPEGEGFINLALQGVSPWRINYLIDGSPASSASIQTNNFRFPISQSGRYEFVNIRDAYCTGIFSDTITVRGSDVTFDASIVETPCLFADAGAITIIPRNQDIKHTIFWDQLQSRAFEINNLFAGTYTFSLSDVNNCTIQDSVVVPASEFAADCQELFEGQIYVPTAFTPNGDGSNDHFKIFPQTNFINSMSFDVLDRWGNRLFRSRSFSPDDSENHFWEGKDAAIGVYVCHIRIELVDGSALDFARDVTLIR